jgi:hypothetical protein
VALGSALDWPVLGKDAAPDDDDEEKELITRSGWAASLCCGGAFAYDCCGLPLSDPEGSSTAFAARSPFDKRCAKCFGSLCASGAARGGSWKLDLDAARKAPNS